MGSMKFVLRKRRPVSTEVDKPRPYLRKVFGKERWWHTDDISEATVFEFVISGNPQVPAVSIVPPLPVRPTDRKDYEIVPVTLHPRKAEPLPEQT